VTAGSAEVRAALPPALGEALAGYEEHLAAQQDLS
jgi:integrase/recombinase XerC